MSKSKKALLSIGVALATKKLVNWVSDLEFDDVLRPIGLERRRSHWGETAITLGVGMLVGGTAALLLAPSNGKEARSRLTAKVNEMAENALRDGGGDVTNGADNQAAERRENFTDAQSPS
jgi:hypothetical protein